MKGIRTYKTAIAISFVLAFLAQALIHASFSHEFDQKSDKSWAKEIHKTFNQVLLVKQHKVKLVKYQLVKKFEFGRILGKPGLPFFVNNTKQQSHSCQGFTAGASLLQFICVLLL